MQKNTNRFESWIFWLASAAILTGFILTIISWLELCSSSCSEAHTFRLFRFKFEIFGLIFFTTIGLIHAMSYWNPTYRYLNGLIIASGIGAESLFILIQKKIVGSYCPICLSIAGMLALVAILYLLNFYKKLVTVHNKINREAIMQNLWKGISSISMVMIGFFIGFVGITKFDPLDAKEKSIKEQISFGDSDNPIEVYLFTDWLCPACKKLEPNIDTLVDKISEKAQFIFVDYAVHPETMNFLPYNISFEIYNKPQYFQLRDKLTRLAQKTSSPTEEQVEKTIAPLGIKYKELNYSDVALATSYFNELGEKFKVKGTPTMVIINTETKKGKRLIGIEEITTLNALRAIEKLKGS